MQQRIQDFPDVGSPTQPIIWPIFAENCKKMKKIEGGQGGTRAKCSHVDPPLSWNKCVLNVCLGISYGYISVSEFDRICILGVFTVFDMPLL